MIISAKSLFGEYVSIEITDSSRINEEFEQKYKELYVDPKVRPFVSVSLLESALIYADDKIESEWSFLVNTHKLALCLERYEDSWMSLSLNPHPYVIEMFQNLDEEDKRDNIYKGLSRNPVAIDFFIKNPDKISWPDMLRYNNRVWEVLYLYRCKHKKLLWNQIIRYSPDAYNFVCSHIGYDQFDWDEFLQNKHIRPEWVEYVIEREPRVWGEFIDSEGEEHGEFEYTFRLEKQHWKNFSKMPIMIPLLIKYMDKICWKELCENPSVDAIELLRCNPDKVVISSLCNNHTSHAISFLEELKPDLYINKKSWSFLCKNPYAIHIIERYPSSIKYEQLANNTNERAIEMIKSHLSIHTLSKDYRNRILKNLIENESSGWLVLELFERGEFEHLDYKYTYNILTKPYIFCPEM